MTAAVSATELKIPSAEQLMEAADVAFANMERENEDQRAGRNSFAGFRLGLRKAHA